MGGFSVPCKLDRSLVLLTYTKNERGRIYTMLKKLTISCISLGVVFAVLSFTNNEETYTTRTNNVNIPNAVTRTSVMTSEGETISSSEIPTEYLQNYGSGLQHDHSSLFTNSLPK